MKTINRSRLRDLMQKEQECFAREHPRSQELFARARKSLLGGVPMNWMAKWAGGFPLFVERAEGAHFTDVDGREYVDLCLGDTGAMTGHSPAAAAQAIAEQVRRGITFMLPTEDSVWVGEELRRRFGLPYWQFCLTATDANRFSLRMAREITGRTRVLVFNWCYHGTVDESFITLEDGQARARRGNLGPPVDPTVTTRVVEFNDVAALKQALSHRDVACVLAEPAMTNIGIIHPEPGFHQALRELTRHYGTLLILDETHTICAGPGGYTRAHDLDPDFFVLGKPVASGLPAATYGFTEKVAQRIAERISLEDCDTGGIGGTLAGNALSLAAMRATLEHVLTEAAFARMIPLAARFASGVEDVIRGFEVPWCVTQLGCRAEYRFTPTPPRNGSEAAAAADFELERFLHLYALNRGILLTPFHNMALMSPATSEAGVDLHTRVFRECVAALVA
ncbi:MAG: aspartate aminotransferase family protein [Terriglobales bacterium]